MSVPSIILGQVFVRKSFAFAGFSLLVYDHVITFSLEVTYIWNSPWTVVKAGFFLNRYGNLIGQAYILLEETGYLSHGSQKYCAAFWIYCALFAVFSGESIRILVLIRAWAIWRCNRSIGILLFSFYVTYIATVIMMVAYTGKDAYFSEFKYLAELGICLGPMKSDAWKFCFATMLLDSFVLVVACYNLFQVAKESPVFHPSALVRLLVRDALLFYCASLVNGVFSIVCWTAYREDPRNFLQSLLSFPLLSIIGQRLVLNLRGLQIRLGTSDLSLEIDRQIAALGDLDQPWGLEGSGDEAPQPLDDEDVKHALG